MVVARSGRGAEGEGLWLRPAPPAPAQLRGASKANRRLGLSRTVPAFRKSSEGPSSYSGPFPKSALRNLEAKSEGRTESAAGPLPGLSSKVMSSFLVFLPPSLHPNQRPFGRVSLHGPSPSLM